MRKLLFPKVFPEMLHWIEFGTVCWLADQADIVGDIQVFGLVPTGLIHLHDNEIVREGCRNMLQKQVHHGRIGVRKDERGHFPLCWGNGGVHIGIDLSWGSRSNTRWCPGTSELTDPAKAPFILSHLKHWPFIGWLACRYGFLDLGLEVFLKSACSSTSAFGCRGRGINLRQPCRCSKR